MRKILKLDSQEGIQQIQQKIKECFYCQKIKIKYQLINLSKKEIQTISDTLSKIKGLEKVTINLQYDLSESDLYFLSVILEGLEQIQELTLKFGDYFISEGIRFLKQSFKKTKQLQKLKIILGQYSRIDDYIINDRGFKDFFQGIGYLTNLQELKIIVSTGQTISLNYYSNIKQYLTQLQSLTYLKLALWQNNLSKYILKDIIYGLTSLKNLQTLVFQIQDFRIDDDYMFLFENILLKLKNLKSFKTNAQQKVLERMLKFIKEHKNLQEIKIENRLSSTNFYFIDNFKQILKAKNLKRIEYIDYCDQCNDSDIEQIQINPNIESLVLSLHPRNWNNNQVIHIGPILKSIVNLQNLDIELTYNSSSSECVREIGKSLKGLTQLTQLKLSFSGIIYLNGLIKLANGIQQLINLKVLTLIFNQSSSIHEEGINVLTQSYSGLVNLSKLELQISQVEDVCQRGLHQIFKQLSNLKLLQQFKLNLFYSFIEHFNNQCQLNEGLSKLSSLLELDIIIQKDKFSTLQMENFGEQLRYLKQLQVLKLNFEGLNSQKNLNNFSNAFKYLSNLKILSLDLRINMKNFFQLLKNLQYCKIYDLKLKMRNQYINKMQFRDILSSLNRIITLSNLHLSFLVEEPEIKIKDLMKKKIHRLVNFSITCEIFDQEDSFNTDFFESEEEEEDDVEDSIEQSDFEIYNNEKFSEEEQIQSQGDNLLQIEGNNENINEEKENGQQNNILN